MTKPTPNPSNRSPTAEPLGPCEATIRRRIVQTQRQLKGVDLTGGVLTLLVGALVYLLAAAVIDHWLVDGGLGFWDRWWLCLLFWIGVGVVFVRQLLPSLRWRIHPLYAASTLEQSRPSLKNSLINFLWLCGHRREIAAPIYQAVEQRAAADLSGIESDAAVDRTSVVRLGVALAVVLAVFAVYLVVSPKNPLRSAARVLWPWSDVAAPTRVTIREVRPGNVVAFYGDRINVSAEIVGLGDAESPQLFYSTADGQTVEQSMPMTRPEGEYRYQCDLPPDPSGLQQSCQYWIAVGDARGQSYQVSVQPAPAIEIDRVEYHYPAHLGLSDRTVSRQGDLRAVEGTEVTIHAKTNVDIKPGTAEIDLGCTGRHGLRMTATGGEAVGRFTLRLKTPEPNENLRVPTAEYNTYQIRFADLQGRENPRPVRYQIEVLPDLSERQPPASQPKNAETSADRRQPKQNVDEHARGGENQSATGSTEPKSADGGRGGQAAERSQTPSPNASDASPSASSHPSEPQKLAAQTDQRPDQRIDPDSNPADAIQEILNDRKQQQGASKGDTSDQSSADQPPSQQPSAGGEQKSSGNESSSQAQSKSGQSQPQSGGEKSGQSQPQSGGEKSGGGEKSSSSQKQNQGSASGDQGQSQHGDSSQASSDAQRQAGSSGSDQQKSAAPSSPDGNREKPESAASESKDQQGRESQQGKGERQSSDSAGGQENKGPSSGASKENAPQPGGSSSEQSSASGPTGDRQKSGDAKSDGQKSEGPKTDGGRGDGQPSNGENRGDRSPSEKLGNAQNGGPEKATSKQPNGEKSGEKPKAQAADGSQTGDQPSGVKTLEPSRADSAERKQPGLPQAGDQPKPEKGHGLENPAVPPKPQGDGSPSQGQPMPFPKPESGSSGQTSSEAADRNSAATTDKKNVEGHGNAQEKQSTDASGDTPGDAQKSADQPPDSNLPPGTSNRLDSQKRAGAGEGKTPPSDAHPGEVSSEEPSGPSTNKPAEFDVANPQGKGSRPTDRPVAEDLKSGGRPGKSSDEKPPHEPTDAMADRANLEYARRQTELALEYLRDQLQQEKPKLLERLGWSKEDAQRFLQRWQQMEESASQPGPESQSARQRLDAELRSLGLRPKGVELRHGAVPVDRAQGSRDASRYAPPPADWAEQYREYTRGVASQRETDDSPDRRGR